MRRSRFSDLQRFVALLALGGLISLAAVSLGAPVEETDRASEACLACSDCEGGECQGESPLAEHHHCCASSCASHAALLLTAAVTCGAPANARRVALPAAPPRAPRSPEPPYRPPRA